MSPAGNGVHVIGRAPELDILRRFVDGEFPVRALMLTGDPGAGKTTLWEAAIDLARSRGHRVLTARPSSAETQLSFGALIDLCEEIDEEVLARLPEPQRVAVEVALLRAAPAGEAAEPQAIALGLLNALRATSERAPVLVAVDDLQWLDGPSAEALAFAARRLEDGAVRLLLARRPGHRSAPERALERGALERVQVGPLAAEDIRLLLFERLSLTLPRRLLRQLVDSTLGNPLFAIEVGRALAEGGLPEVGEDLPVPGAVEELLSTRVGRLPEHVRRVLLAVALSGGLHDHELAGLEGEAAIEEAIDNGVLVRDGERLRASHPLLAAAVRKRSGRRERRDLHLALAGVVADTELGAHHLAIATERPDALLAAMVAAAASSASARGAAAEAVQLAEHALRLTPPDRPERSERLLALAGYLETVGARQRVTELLEPALDSLPPGRWRVRALVLLSEGGAVTSYDDHRRHLEHALAEASDDPELRAYVLAKKAINTVAEGVERVPEAEAWALEALPHAARAGPDVERLALRGLGWARCLRGRPIGDVCERFVAASPSASHLTDSPAPVAGLRRLWRGELQAARETATRYLQIADERGEALSYAWLRLNLCEVELRAGAWDAAAALLDEWGSSGDRRLLIGPTYQRCRALLAAGRGDAEEARRWATPALAEAQARGYRWQVLEAQRALGLAALVANEPAAAVEHLRAVWTHTLREGVDEPGAFPVALDLVEALLIAGGVAEATHVIDCLRALAEEQEHPWARAGARRGDAVVRLAGRPYDEAAATALAEVAAEYDELGLRFDAARTLLSLGRAQRRHRKWGAAREALEGAVAAFERLGSPGWAEHTRAELGRVGARKPSPSGALTPAERRVVELAAEGRANKEIATALVITVRTVEAHLRSAYAKLGVRSRAQLASRITELRRRERA